MLYTNPGIDLFKGNSWLWSDIAYKQWKSWTDFLAGKTKNCELRIKPTD